MAQEIFHEGAAPQVTPQGLEEVHSPFEIPEPPLPPLPDPISEKTANGVKRETSLIYRFEDKNGRPENHKGVEATLRRRYGVRGQVRARLQFETDEPEITFTSRHTDPPPPSHDLGSIEMEDLDLLSRDPEVLEIFAEGHSQRKSEEDVRVLADSESGQVVDDLIEDPIDGDPVIVSEESFSTSDGQVVTIRVTEDDISNQMRPEDADATFKMNDPAFRQTYSPLAEDEEFERQDYTPKD